MNIKKLTFIALAAATTLAFAAPQLYQKEYDEHPAEGEPLRMVIQEVERNEYTSTLVVTYSSGATVAAVLAITRAAYDIAKARKARFFINLKEWEDEEGRFNYIIGFTNKKQPDPLSFFGIPDSDKQGDELQYMAVKDLDLMFGNKE